MEPFEYQGNDAREVFGACSAWTDVYGLIHRAALDIDTDGVIAYVDTSCRATLTERDYWRLDPTRRPTCLACLAEEDP